VEEEPEKLIPRTVRLPDKVWKAVGKDATRCKRTVDKQLDAILTKRYNLGNVDLDFNEQDLSPAIQATEDDS
jgi:hypothetical protein